MKRFSFYVFFTFLSTISGSAQSDFVCSAMKLFRLDFTQAAIDVLITPSFGMDQMLMTNLKGDPCVVLPDGSYADGKPRPISLFSNFFGKASILHFARYLQVISPFVKEHPQMFQ